MAETVHLLANPTARAGRAAEDVAVVTAALAAAGAEVVPVAAEGRDAVRAGLRGVLAAGATRIVVAGGDGLVHLAVQELAGSGVTAGIVPVGTGNDFGRALGIPEGDIPAAVAGALGEPTDLDLVRTEHGWIASVATLGFSATVNARANRLSRPRGARRYTVATLIEIPRFHARPIALHVDGVRHELDAAIVAAGNTAYFGGGMKVCPEADPTDGLLDVVVIGDVGRLELLRMLPTVYRAEHVRHPAVRRLRGRVVRIERTDMPVETEAGPDADAPVEDGLWGDGEPVGPLPVTIEAVPGALRLAGVAIGALRPPDGPGAP